MKKLFAFVLCALALAAFAEEKTGNAVPQGHAELCRRAAAEGMVLLENKNRALPLTKGEKIALIGKAQIHFSQTGTGSGDVYAYYSVNFLMGAEARAEKGDIVIDKELADKYKAEENYFPTLEELQKTAENYPAAFVFISRNCGENSSRQLSKGDYYLTDEEEKLIDETAKAGFKKIVLVINSGALIDFSFMDRYPIDALILAWQPGMEGGNAFWDIACGDFSPCGKLADTVPKNYSDLPSSSCFRESREYTNYKEDVYVGYRYFETFDPQYLKVRYPFGYGLSYTKFIYESLAPRIENNEFSVECSVRNVGRIPGREVVQVYFSRPQGQDGAPAMELAAYGKTKLLQPNESDTFTISFPLEQMKTFREKPRRCYVMAKGTYNFYVGNSVKNARESGVMGTYSRTCDEILQSQDLAKLPPPVFLQNVLKSDGTYDLPNQGALEDQEALGLVKDNGQVMSPFCLRKRGWNAWTSNGLDFTKEPTALILPKGEWIEYLVYNNDGDPDDLRLAVNAGAKLSASLDFGKYEDIVVPAEGEKVSTEPLRFHSSSGYHVLRIKNLSPDDHAYIYGIALNAPEEIKAPEWPALKELPKGGEMSFEAVVADLDKIEAFIDSLTVEELAALSCGQGSGISSTGSVGSMSDREVETLHTADGPAGLRLNTPQTAWPVEALLACTWDTDLLNKVGRAIGEEMEKAGIAVWLAPGLNIHRDPLCGRNFEYYSEDPYLTGTLAAALIKGVQAKGDRGVEMKHFCANNREENRLNNDSRVSERALREIYLKAFEIAVKEAKPWAIMCSYNCFNGIHTAESKALLTDLLRGEWGFDGFVTTDWGSHSVCWKEVKAGCNIQMPWGETKELIAAYKLGLITLDELRSSVEPLLRKAAQYAKNAPKKPFAATEQPEGSLWRLIGTEAGKISSGLGAETCEDETGGRNLTNISAKGSYFAYKLNVKDPGTYKVSVRFSSPDGSGAAKVLLNGQEKFVWENNVKTGSWQAWQTAENVAQIELAEGEQELKIVSLGGQFNINYLDLVKEN